MNDPRWALWVLVQNQHTLQAQHMAQAQLREGLQDQHTLQAQRKAQAQLREVLQVQAAATLLMMHQREQQAEHLTALV